MRGVLQPPLADVTELAVCALQSVAACCCVLQPPWAIVVEFPVRVLHFVAVCCSVLQPLLAIDAKLAARVLQCVAVCCSVLQCAAVCFEPSLAIVTEHNACVCLHAHVYFCICS